jgi:CRP-like cAMP-binding protein
MNLEQYGSLAFFNGLNVEDLQALAPFFTSVTYVAGTTIFQQGELATNLYLVARGEVAIRYKPDDGPTMTVTRIQPGGIFGWSSAVGNITYTSGAVCSLDSEVLSIRGTELRRLCDSNPRIGVLLLGRLSLVVAERQHGKPDKVASTLANGFRQVNGSGDNQS